MRAQDFPGWLAAIAGLSAEQRGEAVLALAKAGEGAAAPEDFAAPSPGKRSRQADGGRDWNDQVV